MILCLRVGHLFLRADRVQKLVAWTKEGGMNWFSMLAGLGQRPMGLDWPRFQESSKPTWICTGDNPPCKSTVRAEIINELILERAGPIIFKTSFYWNL